VRAQKKYPKRGPKQKKAKLVVRTAVINGVEIPTEDIPSDVSQWDSQSDNSDSDSEYVPQITLVSGMHNNQKELEVNDCTELPNNDIDGDENQTQHDHHVELREVESTLNEEVVESTNNTSETSKRKKINTTQSPVRVTRRSVKNTLPPSTRTRSKC